MVVMQQNGTPAYTACTAAIHSLQLAEPAQLRVVVVVVLLLLEVAVTVTEAGAAAIPASSSRTLLFCLTLFRTLPPDAPATTDTVEAGSNGKGGKDTWDTAPSPSKAELDVDVDVDVDEGVSVITWRDDDKDVDDKEEVDFSRPQLIA